MSDTITITAEKMVFGGDCIGKFNGKTVFVPYAIPGEKISTLKKDIDKLFVERLTPFEIKIILWYTV